MIETETKSYTYTGEESADSKEYCHQAVKAACGYANPSDAERDGAKTKQETSGKQNASNKLGFSKVEFREYERTVGVNPSARGPPIELGWGYNKAFELPLEEWEENRGPRRSYAEMAMPKEVRQQMLIQEWGFDRKSINIAIREATKIKVSRQRTVAQIGSGNEKAEYALEKMRRGTKKMFRQKSKDPVVWYEKNQDEVLRHSLHCIKGLCL